MGRLYIDKTNGKIERTDLYLVKLIGDDGTVIENLEPRRLFPLSDPNHYIVLLDSNEKEVAMIRDITALDALSQKALLDCFREYYLIPKITQVLEVTDKFGVLRFKVMTDRGEISFHIRNRHSDIKNLGANRIIIRDADDNRYEIPDYTALDTRSRRLLFSYV